MVGTKLLVQSWNMSRWVRLFVNWYTKLLCQPIDQKYLTGHINSLWSTNHDHNEFYILATGNMNMRIWKLFILLENVFWMYGFFRFDKPPLIIVSLDGFRADYMKRNLTPVLDKIGRCGVRTDRMRSIFPTKTFPNHFSIVTVSFLSGFPRYFRNKM